MNKTFLQLESSPDLQLIDTPLAFGGNMVITKECWIKVPFDPLIRRGEDMDFLRNVKHAGFEAKLDRSISIIHCPPTSTSSYVHKFKQDTFRFLYAKYKMEALGIDPKDYQPYPGYFLESTEAKVLITELLYNISHYHQDLMNIQSWNDLVEKLQNFPSIFSKALAFAKDHAKSYLHFQAQWQKLLISLALDDSFVLTERI